MSFTRTYVHSILVGLDDLAAALLFNRCDCTISSLCRLAQLGLLDRIDAHPWHRWFLTRLAPVLDRIQPNHCELARLADLRRGRSAAQLLGV